MKKSKIFMIVSICILCISLIGTTVAYYTKLLFSTTVGTVTHGLDYYINYENGKTISTNILNPSEDYTGGSYSDVELWKIDNTYDIYGHMYLDITTMSDALSNSEAVKYTIVNNNTVIAEGIVKNNEQNTILMKSNIPLQTAKQLYRVYIWLDSNLDLDPTLTDSALSLSVRCEATMIPEKVNLIEHISNLYTPNSTATNNGITYNLDTTDFLMNDRLGSMTVSAGSGNIRYYGATPDNYIDIGDTELNEEGEEVPTLYRIIGLFKDVELSDGTKKDLIKVVRNDSIGKYSWDQSPSDVNNGWGINEWSQSDLMKLLNPVNTNESVGVSLYWNSGSGTCYGYDSSSKTYKAIPCDFTNKGLSTNARTKIETVKWNLGGWNSNSVYPNQIYEYERGDNLIQNSSDGIERTSVWPGKVALAYPSDYGYAVDLDSCDTTLDNYSSCAGTNWMYPRLTFTSSIDSWLLTPFSTSANHAWLVGSGGGVYSNYNAFYGGGVSPVFYLDSALMIMSGTGNEKDPYIVS